MSRGGAVFPASQGFYCDRATKRTGLLPVEPEAEAFFTEHVLWGQKGIVKVRSVPTRAYSVGQRWEQGRIPVQADNAADQQHSHGTKKKPQHY